ncbi:unnamed protein product, partial [Larinioides sclopetarius]
RLLDVDWSLLGAILAVAVVVRWEEAVVGAVVVVCDVVVKRSQPCSLLERIIIAKRNYGIYKVIDREECFSFDPLQLWALQSTQSTGDKVWKFIRLISFITHAQFSLLC